MCTGCAGSYLSSDLTHVVIVVRKESAMPRAADELTDVAIRNGESVVKHGDEGGLNRWCVASAADAGDRSHHSIVL